jgi:hypothetical protein
MVSLGVGDKLLKVGERYQPNSFKNKDKIVRQIEHIRHGRVGWWRGKLPGKDLKGLPGSEIFILVRTRRMDFGPLHPRYLETEYFTARYFADHHEKVDA